jgi:hypothetical protein
LAVTQDLLVLGTLALPQQNSKSIMLVAGGDLIINNLDIQTQQPASLLIQSLTGKIEIQSITGKGYSLCNSIGSQNLSSLKLRFESQKGIYVEHHTIAGTTSGCEIERNGPLWPRHREVARLPPELCS